METVMILKRNGLARLLALFIKDREIFLTDLKRSIAKSSFYGQMLKDVMVLNQAVARTHPGVELVHPGFKINPMTSTVQHTIRLHDQARIEDMPDCVLIHIDEVEP